MAVDTTGQDRVENTAAAARECLVDLHSSHANPAHNRSELLKMLSGVGATEADKAAARPLDTPDSPREPLIAAALPAEPCRAHRMTKRNIPGLMHSDLPLPKSTTCREAGSSPLQS